MGIQLERAGIDSFAIFEKADDLGGTWRDNTYPGAACDSPCFAYCYSFEQKTDWSHKWAPQAEILEYIGHCADKYGLRPHIRFGTEIAGARFDDEEGVWQLETTGGERFVAEILVSAVGQLSRPAVPEIAGLASFRGDCFHSARWNHDVELEGRNVAVVGNAASAIQFIPEIAPLARRLTIFQRSANWMIPRGDRAYRESEKRRFGRHPWLARLYRWSLWLRFEIRFPVFRQNRIMSRSMARLCEMSMRSLVADRELQEHLIPDYPIGGRRFLISDDYYQALGRDNVEVVTCGIDYLTADAVVDSDGRSHPADVVILATGFESTSFLAPMKIEGPGRRSLEQEWKDGAKAYLGISVAGFPNFFVMYGPNTNLGHNSILFMIECQARYILECVQRMEALDLKYLDLRREVMDDYNERLQRELAGTVWAATPRSWYKTADGKITNNWSGTTARYWWRTRKVDLDLYHQRRLGS
jgi:cation diffusion facilitator CzcD-associated flavoprotein CzcO